MTETEILKGKLKICRAIMRQHNIGHLYPGASKQYEEEIKKSMSLMGKEDRQALYTAAKYNQMDSAHKSYIINELAKLLVDNNIAIPEHLLKSDGKNTAALKQIML